MHKRLHTFAICAYNESEFLENCIISLRHQSVSSDIILVTHTPNVFLMNICEKYDIKMFVNKGETGITQDWNYALNVCKTKYVTIAHQDDEYEPDYTRQVICYMKRAKKPLIAFTDYYEIRDGKKYSSSTMIRIKNLLLFPLRRL